MSTIDYKIVQNYTPPVSNCQLIVALIFHYRFLYSAYQTQSVNNSCFVFSSRYQFHTLNWIKHKYQVKSDKTHHEDQFLPPNYLKKFRNCFSDIGYLPGKHHTNHPPDVNPLRWIPYALWKVKSLIGQDVRNENNSR